MTNGDFCFALFKFTIYISYFISASLIKKATNKETNEIPPNTVIK